MRVKCDLARADDDTMSVVFFTVAEIGVLSAMAAGLFRKRAVLRPARVANPDA